MFERQYALNHPPLPPEQLQKLRKKPFLLLYVQNADKDGVDRSVLEVAQRWVVAGAGIKDSDACELQGAKLALFADAVPATELRFQRVSARLTELVAGVALANVSFQFTNLPKDQTNLAELDHHFFHFVSDDTLLMMHIAALARLAPRATNLYARTLSLGPGWCDCPSDPLLWLAACRLLFPKLPQLPSPPQHLDFRVIDFNDDPDLGSRLVHCLLTEPGLQTLLDSITIYAGQLEQEAEVRKAVLLSTWAETTSQTLTAICTTVLMGMCRSQTSPLRGLTPAVVPMNMKHIKLCALVIVQDEKTESESEDEGTDEESEWSDGWHVFQNGNKLLWIDDEAKRRSMFWHMLDVAELEYCHGCRSSFVLPWSTP